MHIWTIYGKFESPQNSELLSIGKGLIPSLNQADFF